MSRSTLVVELQGDLFAAPLEQLVRLVAARDAAIDTVVLDLTRAGGTDGSTGDLLTGLTADLRDNRGELLVADPRGVLRDVDLPPTLPIGSDLRDVLRTCEERLLQRAGRPHPAAARVQPESLQLLRGLVPAEQVEVQALMQPVRAARGAVLIRQDAPADAVWVLLSGSLTVSVNDDEAEGQSRVADLYPGVVFGETAALPGEQVRAATVTATSDVQCLVLPVAALDELRTTSPSTYAHLLLQLLAGVTARLRRANAEASAMRACPIAVR